MLIFLFLTLISVEILLALRFFMMMHKVWDRVKKKQH